jgi:V-type H+-transporting ATPase subunit a
MGAIYRSELMSLCQLFLQTDSAFEAVAELGEISLCQFRDLNPDASAYQRKFIHEVRRCEAMERKLRVVRDELEKDEMNIPDVNHKVPTPTPRDIHELESKFEKIDEEVATINSSTAGLKKNYMKLQEIKHVLRKVRHQLDEGQRREAFKSISEQQHMENGHNAHMHLQAEDDLKVKGESDLKFVAGVIRRDRVLAFERVLWRLCRGNVYARTEDIEMDNHHAFREDHEMSVFILFFSGEQLRTRVRKICEGFRAIIVDVPETEAQRSELNINVQNQLEDMQTVVGQTLDHRNIVLSAAAQNLHLWEIQVLKLKAVFHTLNMFSIDVTQKCLIAECWIPTCDIHVVQNALMHASKLSGSTVPSVLHQMETSETPPTHFRLNKFTQGFQNIVHAYGIASYREVNPAPFTIISFPFIFAVMFGDTGHGIIMFLAALLLVMFEKKIDAAKIKDEIFNTFYGGRYVILLMGLFSMYTGLVYNDIYSRSINIFGSQWRNPYTFRLLNETLVAQDAQQSDTEIEFQLPPDPAFLDDQGPYPFGLDPIWNLAENKLNYMNPMKMKSSVIIGIAQMTFGLFLSLLNYWHKGSWIDFLFVFIPQLLFLSLIFIYLCVQIVLKWVFFYVRPRQVFGQLYPGSNCAPSLLIGLINMFMMKSREKGFVDKNGKTLDQCHQQLWYPHQDVIETGFLLVAVLSIPVMLFVKPLIQKWKVSKGQHVEVHSDDGGHGEFVFADVMVYQAIHTIEFVLGCISHTASYLRLWALSLAHAQLSEVLWEMVMRMGFTMKGAAGAAAIFLIFWAFSILSVCILILMEGLSAFLHAIRLHW